MASITSNKGTCCHGNLETVAIGWLNEGARRCATMGPAQDCANRDNSVYPGSRPSTPEVKPLLPACFVLSRSSPAKCCRPSRDVPTPRPIRLAAANQPPAGVWLLGTCSLGTWARAPFVRMLQRHVQSASPPTTLSGNHGGCPIFMRSWRMTKGSVANSPWVKHTTDLPLPLLN
jgi:hypothetical protein